MKVTIDDLHYTVSENPEVTATVPHRGSFDFSGFNDVTMQVIFVMTTYYNDNPNENRVNHELMGSSMRYLDCASYHYHIENKTLDNIHVVIDGPNVRCGNDGMWTMEYRHYFDRKTGIGFVIDPYDDTQESQRIKGLYVTSGTGMANAINKFIADNKITTNPPYDYQGHIIVANL